VVFSYWTFTLDLIEILLKDVGIQFTRIDGKLSGDSRDMAIQKLETDENIKVILVSITCGGTGYVSLFSQSIALSPRGNF
jgi:SWI/SNF-related matrix-associated actin-dependent regulator of chromatin subfamily A3